MRALCLRCSRTSLSLCLVICCVKYCREEDAEGVRKRRLAVSDGVAGVGVKAKAAFTGGRRAVSGWPSSA